MAESRREVEEEEGTRSTTDHPERTKTDHFQSSQGPLSSLRAAIKRTRTNTQSDHCRDRRRPEITIISAEPLGSSNWFSGPSLVFRPTPLQSQSGWSNGIQLPPSYDQVIKEKTQEEHKPTADPFRSTCCATQTDPVRDGASTTTVPQCSAAPQTVTASSAGKKLQKPPRPSLTKSANKAAANEPVISSDGRVALNASPSDVKESEGAESTVACVRSVVVHWDIPTTPPAISETAPSSSGSDHCHRPVPLPRTKFQKQVERDEADAPTLIKLSENRDSFYASLTTDPEEDLNKYLKELLQVYSADNGEEILADQSDEPTQGEDATGEMNTNNSQRNIRARIQAFESQAATNEDNGVEHSKPEPQPRKSINKPPVSATPFNPHVSQSTENEYEEIIPADFHQNPAPAPRPQPPKKPVALPIKDEPEAVPTQQRSRPPMLTRSKTIQEEGATPAPPMPPLKPLKQPLKPNLNINNHNSASVVRENAYVESPTHRVGVKPQHSVDSGGDSFSKQSGTRRPTMIRVPSKPSTLSESFQDSAPPPLPAEKPVGFFNPSVSQRQSPVLVLPSAQSQSFQESSSKWAEPKPPPRPVGGKTLPPRPPPAKAGPGRPPPPRLDVAGRSQSTPLSPWEASPKPQAQRPQGKLLLPPRPKPGHRLYNKYTLQLPHGIASFDYNGTNHGELSFQKNEVLVLLEEIDHNTFECQAGEVRGRVHKSHIKIITPLYAVSDTSPPQGAGSGTAEGGMTVQSIYDFFPEGPGELGLKAGDVVSMVEQVDDQWYRGSCRGSTGFFPINYVNVLFDSPKPVPERKEQPPPTAVSGPRCVARFDFEGEHSDELSFSEGDVIQLKAYIGQDWARGQIGVLTGIFPLNFVEVIEDLPPSPSQQRTQSSRIALPGMVALPSANAEAAKPAQAAQSGVEWAVALYDFAGKNEGDLSFQQGDCILITQHIDSEWTSGRLNGREGIFPTAFVESSTGQRASTQGNGGTTGRVLYGHKSNCDEELSLQVGDLITNLESVDGEWFLGDSRGKRALVPKSYIQVLG